RPERNRAGEVAAGDRDSGCRFEVELAAGERHFEGGRIVRISDEQVRGPEGEGVGCARGGDAEVRPAEAPEVLHRRQETGRYHLDAAQKRASGVGTKRTRSPMRSRG